MAIDGMIHRQRVIVCRFSRESGRMAKGANRMPCQTIQSYHSFLTSVYVNGFITAVQMIRNVFSEQVFYGANAALCLYRTDTPHSFLTFRRKLY